MSQIGVANNLIPSNGVSGTFVFVSQLGKNIASDFQGIGGHHDIFQSPSNVFNNFATALAHAAQIEQNVTVDLLDPAMVKSPQHSSFQQHDIHIV